MDPMGAFGVAANVAQLLSIVGPTVKILWGVVSLLRNRPPSFHQHQRNIELLLMVVDSVDWQAFLLSGTDRHITSLLIDISALAVRVSNEARKRYSFLSAFLFGSARHSTLLGLVQALEARTSILHLLLNHHTYRILSDIQSRLYGFQGAPLRSLEKAETRSSTLEISTTDSGDIRYCTVEREERAGRAGVQTSNRVPVQDNRVYSQVGLATLASLAAGAASIAAGQVAIVLVCRDPRAAFGGARAGLGPGTVSRRAPPTLPSLRDVDEMTEKEGEGLSP
ncbi:hypothetical protein GGTG_13148 [Gaeumannomyces tritici R3-111a-1]|uniref:Uncharacterized protein n=1 Tax=Gaeumannomyces tritici (strain R3-111a-1) TaxID=644352 RepID=J3PI17_GAET3|nr:hypothetical protein GGTG_13148 [Gaeumannomyces tritici R3-111a-1]EJT69529.1 hypothetical protein GGTG_13148 [Gaeumannomyces tritici R3-111a-1]